MKADLNITDAQLKDYCLGQSPEHLYKYIEDACNISIDIKQRLEEQESLIEQEIIQTATSPNISLKNKIWETLENLNKEDNISADNLPLLNRFSDYKKWLPFVKSMMPAELNEDILAKDIRTDDAVTQAIIWTKIGYPDEVHTDEYESFLVVEGSCKCKIGESIYHLSAGDFIEIPLYQHHDVVATSEYVMAVVQRRKIAA